MNRIRITGSSGTGKSYLAKEISQQLGHPHLELASIYHQPNWGKPEIEEFRRKFLTSSIEILGSSMGTIPM
ncbi:MAG: hypothetical protein WDO06_08555 [Actinomycetota bacterium]